MSENQKPKCQLTGIDGNVFNIIGTVSKTLKRAGLNDKAKMICKDGLGVLKILIKQYL